MDISAKKYARILVSIFIIGFISGAGSLFSVNKLMVSADSAAHHITVVTEKEDTTTILVNDTGISIKQPNQQ